MPTKPRNIKPDNYYHVYNRAVEKRTIFYTDRDYEFFINKLLFYKEKTKVKILAYSVLPNHWHFLLKEPKSDPAGQNPQISKFISLISNSYTKYFNISKNHSGRVFQGPFKSKLVDDQNYLYILINYINLNHLKHKICQKADQWPYTSHRNYLNQNKYNLVDKDYLIDFDEYKKDAREYIKILKNIKYEF